MKGLPSWKVEKGSRATRGWSVIIPPTQEGEALLWVFSDPEKSPVWRVAGA